MQRAGRSSSIYRLLLVMGSSLLAGSVVGTNGTESYDNNYFEIAGINICYEVNCFHYSCSEEPWEESLCKCDVGCRTYNDCCYNYTEECLTSTDDRPNPNQHTNMACIAITQVPYVNLLMNGVEQIAIGYYMIDKCPSHYSNQLIRGNCDLADPLNWLTPPPETWSKYNRVIPVLDRQSGTPYKNVYCAWCNGVKIEHIQLWELHPECRWQYVSPRDCGPVYVKLPSKGSHLARTRHCVVLDETRCPASADEVTSRMCDSYYLPVIQDGRSYKNPHCAVCHEPSLNVSSACPQIVSFAAVSRSLADVPQFLPFDFYTQFESDLDDTSQRCAAGFFYNSTSHECTPMYPEISFREGCPYLLEAMALMIYYELGFDHAVVYDVVSLTAEYFGITEADIDQSDCDESENCFRVNIKLSETDALNLTSFDEIEGLYESVRSVIPIERIVLILPCVEPATPYDGMCDEGIIRSLSVENGSLYSTDDTTLILRDFTANRVYFLELLHISLTLPLDDEQDGLMVTLYFCEETFAVEIACPYFILNEDEVTSFSDYIESTLTTEQFLPVANGSAHVCTLPDVNLRYLSIMYIIFSSLSIFLLTVAFLTYCAFNFLRNGPGKLAMNFFVAMATSQLIFLVGATQTHNAAVCTTFAIAGHYTWLAVFVWISIISYSVSRTFGGAMVSHRSNFSNKALLGYMSIGWGIPAIFVGACVMAWYGDLFRFDYGNSKGCWIRPGRVNLFLFGVPSMCCLLFNAFMFVWASIGIRRSMKGAKRVHENKSALFKDEVVLYIKVSILMGFCWIWAYLSGFFPASLLLLVLQTIFIPSQGILVFVIYICNRRMMSKWRSTFSEALSTEGGSSRVTRVYSTQTG